jgi:hypothetical protein
MSPMSLIATRPHGAFGPHDNGDQALVVFRQHSPAGPFTPPANSARKQRNSHQLSDSRLARAEWHFDCYLEPSSRNHCESLCPLGLSQQADLLDLKSDLA